MITMMLPSCPHISLYIPIFPTMSPYSPSCPHTPLVSPSSPLCPHLSPYVPIFPLMFPSFPLMLLSMICSWPFGDTSSIGANAKRQRGSQRSLNKMVVTISNSHGPTSCLKSNTTENYYKPKHVSC